MTDPKYQEFAPERIPRVQPAAGVEVKVIAGSVDGTRGPIVQPATDPLYLDITLAPDRAWTYALPEGHNATPRVTWRARNWRCWAVASSCTSRPAAMARG
ncbi:hypothetical protein G6F66_015047 [Rhizopus arrhizus]|nr:hypothetical protein G6F66_015047 [Rhizopus arrhizus]